MRYKQLDITTARQMGNVNIDVDQSGARVNSITLRHEKAEIRIRADGKHLLVETPDPPTLTQYRVSGQAAGIGIDSIVPSQEEAYSLIKQLCERVKDANDVKLVVAPIQVPV